MKKNLMAVLTASSVAVMAMGTTLAAYGADEVVDALSSIVSRDAVKPTESINKTGFEYAPDTETLTIKTDDGFSAWKDSVPQEFVSTVAIDDSIETIPNEAFKGCTNLKMVNLTNRSCLETIGDSAFEGCTALEQMGFSSTYYSKWNHELQKSESAQVIMPSYNIKSIGDNAFKDCAALKSIFFGENGFESIGNSAFENCTSLKELDIKNYITKIGDSAFKGCTGIKYLKVETYWALTIGISAFEGCTDLRYVDLIGCNGNPLSISEKAFADCHKLWRVALPGRCDYQITIGSQAFYNTYCEGILLPEWNDTTYTNISIAPDFFDCSDDFAETLANPTKYVLYNADGIEDWDSENFCSTLEPKPIPDCITNLHNTVARFSYQTQDESFNSIRDENNQPAIHLTVETELPSEGKVKIPSLIGGGKNPPRVIKFMGKDGDELSTNKYETTYNPLLYKESVSDGGASGGTGGETLAGGVDEPPGGFKNPGDSGSGEDSGDSGSSSGTSSEPTSSGTTPSRPTPPPSRPESSEPESSETESSEPESSEPESSETTPSNSEDEFNPSKPTDIPHNNSESVGSVPNPSDNNPNTGVRFLAPAIVTGAAIVAVASRRRKMK